MKFLIEQEMFFPGCDQVMCIAFNIKDNIVYSSLVLHNKPNYSLSICLQNKPTYANIRKHVLKPSMKKAFVNSNRELK